MIKKSVLPTVPTAISNMRQPYMMASTVMIPATASVAVAFAALGNLLYIFVSLNVYSPFFALQWDADFHGETSVKAYTVLAKSWGIVSCKANGNFPPNVTAGAGPGFRYDLMTSPFDGEEYAQYTWSSTMPVVWVVNWFFVLYCTAVFRKFNKPYVLIDYNSNEVLGVVKLDRVASWIKAFCLTLVHAIYLNEYLFVVFYLLYLMIAYQMENMKCTGMYGIIVANIYRCGGCASLSTWLLIRFSHYSPIFGKKRPLLQKKSRGLIVYTLFYASMPVLAVILHVTGALGAQSWVKCTVGYAVIAKVSEWIMNAAMGFSYRPGKTYLEDVMHRLDLDSMAFLVSCAQDDQGNQSSCVLGGIINVEMLAAIKNPWTELRSCKANAKFNELRVKLNPGSLKYGVIKHNALDPSKPELDVTLPLTQADLFKKDKAFHQYFGFSHQVVYEYGASSNPLPQRGVSNNSGNSSSVRANAFEHDA